MAEYRVEFTADSGSAERSIKNLKKEIRGVTKEFEGAEIGAEDFIAAAGNLSGLQKELKDARSEVVDLDRAYQNLSRSLANFRSGMGARGAISSVASPIRGGAQQFGSPAYFDKLNKDLERAIAEGTRLDAEIRQAARQRQNAINEFRAAMGERGAISGTASPIGGAFNIKGSPLHEQIGSLAKLDRQLTSLREKARLIAPDTKEWRVLNNEILKTGTSIDRINKKQSGGPSAKSRLGAAGGAFLYGGGMGGGVGSAVGGVVGGLMGGPGPAFAGAAIGQAVDNLGTALAGITSQASALQKMQRGLAMASVDAKDFAEAQAAVGAMSQKLLMPLEQTTKYFAQLRANTKEYNLSVADTKEILEGTALAIMATGGSTEDLDGAMRAVVQIMSKGGVQAEELRGQLGERFPGAVVKFAQANKLSFEDLQARLEAGTIGIREFINFAKKNYTDYAKFSEQLATAPEYAGQRLKMALEQISLEVGSLFGPVGADIQDVLTETINGIAQFIKDNRAYLRQMISDFSSIVGPIAKIFMQLMKVIAGFSIQVGTIFQSLFSSIRQSLGMANLGEAKARLDRATKPAAGASKSSRNRPGGGASREYSQALAAYQALGGDAAWTKANAPAQPSNLTFGGAGAGMSIDRAGKEEKEKKKKADSLESFERLRDQLANAYNQAEIERIKARYELQKRLQEDMYDMQEFGANRLQKQNLQFLRALAKAEQDRQDTLMDAQLRVAEAAGKIAPSAPILPSTGSASAGRLPGSISGRLDASGQNGADMPVALNNVMRSYHNGIVTEINKAGNNGNYVVVEFLDDLGNKLEATYSHVAAAVKVGQSVVGGQAIGRFDASGRTFGAHNSVDINTPGTNGALQRNREGAAARRSADILVTGRVQGSVGAGAPRKVGSNESRDTMAGASVDIAEQNAAFAARNALIVKGSAESKAFAQYIQESFGLPDLRLSNDLLKMRNDLIAAGVSEEEITHRQKLFEINYQYNDLLKRYPGLAGLTIDIDGERVSALDYLKDALNEATKAEKDKNDETLRGAYIQERKKIADELAMARALTPDDELRTSIAQRGFTGERAETLFQDEKTKQEAQKLKEDLQSIASSIGNSFGEAFKGIITGSMTAQQALAGMFQSIADSFADMAGQMIAEFMRMQALGLLKTIFGAVAGGLGGGGANLGPNSAAVFGTNSADMMKYAPLPTGYANGGIATGGFTAFANGGMVTGPTMGLVGEGRYNEAIIPLPDGKSVPVQLAGGAGGNAAPVNTSIVVNVKNGQADSQMSGNQGNQLARELEGAVRQVILKESRPGGLISSSR